MTEPIRTLEEAAQARAEAAAEFERACARMAELKPDFDAAVHAKERARERLKQIDDGMAAVRRMHASAVALREAGIEYDGPLLVTTQTYSSTDVYHLCAVGPAGTPLFLHVPEHSARYAGKEWVVRAQDAAAHGVTEAPTGRVEMTRSQHKRAEPELYVWCARGKASGMHFTGAVRPSPPPEGGRWRHLKVREQEALPAGAG